MQICILPMMKRVPGLQHSTRRIFSPSAGLSLSPLAHTWAKQFLYLHARAQHISSGLNPNSFPNVMPPCFHPSTSNLSHRMQFFEVSAHSGRSRLSPGPKPSPVGLSPDSACLKIGVCSPQARHSGRPRSVQCSTLAIATLQTLFNVIT